MRIPRLSALFALSLFAATSATVCAAHPGGQPDAPAKAEMDKPIASFKLPDLSHVAKNGEKEGAALVALDVGCNCDPAR